MNDLYSIVGMLEGYGISMQELEDDVIEGQRPYHVYTREEAKESLTKVMSKMDVQHAIFVAFTLDWAAERGILDQPLQHLLETDAPGFGLDETLGMSIAQLNGPVAVTNMGYIDKMKLGAAGKLNDKGKAFIRGEGGHVTTMIDDIVAGIVASAEARLAKNEEN